ncbi:O-antigen ligase family protein [Yoonia vestfoldensis]|nr:O-antigen ligase family protein [Yoonia vestfoldensis]
MAFMMLLQVLYEGSPEIIQISSLIVFVVLSFIVTTYQKTNLVPMSVLVLFGLLFFMLIFSNLISLEVIGISSFLRMFAIMGYLIIGLLFAARLDHYIIERALPAYAIGLALVLVYVLYDNDRIFARLSGNLHPNLWGFVVATSLPFVFFSKIRLLFKLIISAFFLYLLAFEFQTRAALSWAIFSFVVFLPVRLMGGKSNTNTKLLIISSITIALSALVILIISNLDFVRAVFQFESSTRGVGSGLSGRTALWAEAFHVFQDRPFLGHGFDSGRYYASNFFEVYVAGDIESLHNSYLTMFFDMGVIGGTLYLIIVGLALGGAFASRNIILISFLIVYLGMGITDSRPLNVANPPGLLFVVLLPYLATVFLLRLERKKVTKII